MRCINGVNSWQACLAHTRVFALLDKNNNKFWDGYAVSVTPVSSIFFNRLKIPRFLKNPSFLHVSSALAACLELWGWIIQLGLHWFARGRKYFWVQMSGVFAKIICTTPEIVSEQFCQTKGNSDEDRAVLTFTFSIVRIIVKYFLPPAKNQGSQLNVT